MRYSQAAEAAPAGSATFTAADVTRLPSAFLRVLLGPGPASPPLADLALALGAEPKLLSALDGDRAAELQRLSREGSTAAERSAAAARLVRALFWPLVYELAPDRWDSL